MNKKFSTGRRTEIKLRYIKRQDRLAIVATYDTSLGAVLTISDEEKCDFAYSAVNIYMG
jgi:hypothetical protein